MDKKSILYVNACTGESSRTNALAAHLLNKLDGDVTELRLYQEGISPLDAAAIAERERQLKAGNTGHAALRYACGFASADTIIIAAPYWDLLFPAVLRVYLESVTVPGITFAYSENGAPVGFCRAERLYYITTAGGYIGGNNFGFDYVNALARNLFGIKDVRFISAEGLDIDGADIERILAEAKAKIDAQQD